MADLKDILRKLNKGKKEEDKLGVLGKTSLVRGTISTGSPYLDYLTGGGYLDGGYNTIVADGGTGKSSMALLACKHTIDVKGKYAVYLDGESTLNDSYIDRMGVDRDKLIVKRGRNLEEMLDNAEAFSTADDVGIIIFDSILIFTATSVEEKSAGDNSMTVEARRYAARMPIIEGNCVPRNIGMIGLTSWREKPGAMGDPRYLSRGNWQYTMNNTFLDLTRKKFIFNDLGEEIGHTLDVRVKKTKNSTYDPKKAYNLNFYYDGGFDKIEEYGRLFLQLGIVSQGGAWITYPDVEGVLQKASGISGFLEIISKDEKLFDFLKEEYNKVISE